jgi:DeoR family transcriptional regulator, aga operon transcriptional repressor
VNGLDAGKGLTSLNEAEAEVIAVMMRQSRLRILVADHSKLGAVATHFIAPAEEAHLLITDRGAKEEQLAPLRELGMEVRLV